MHILVTGGAGFIGSHLSERLIRSGHSVTVLDDLSTGQISNFNALTHQPGFEFVEGTILDRELVSKLVEPADIVFHLAAAVGVAEPVAGTRRRHSQDGTIDAGRSRCRD